MSLSGDFGPDFKTTLGSSNGCFYGKEKVFINADHT